MDEHEQLQLLYEIFDPSLPRLGPGDDQSTRRALETLLPRPKHAAFLDGGRARALDIGCGNGASTIQLARLIRGEILALDNHLPYLEELGRRAKAAGVSGRIRPWAMDMRELQADQPPFNLIWSEGALYFLGFAEGLALCHSLLVPGGSVAVSELCWLRPDAPAECSRFFADEYPPMVDIDANLATIRDRGFELVGHFTLPESAWLESYYGPVESRLRLLRPECAAGSQLAQMIELMQTEIDMYRRFSSYYGYAFFLMRR